MPARRAVGRARHRPGPDRRRRTQSFLTETHMNSIHAVKPDLIEFGERRISLCDGRAGLRGGLYVDIREPTAANQAGEVEPASDQLPIPNHPSPVLDFIASNECLDRYDEIVTASGWDLENYRRNPVFQNAHQYGDILFTLGKALLTE